MTNTKVFKLNLSGSVTKLNIQPDDVIVIKYNADKVNDDQLKEQAQILASHLQEMNFTNPVIIQDESFSISTMSIEDIDNLRNAIKDNNDHQYGVDCLNLYKF